MKRFLGWGAFLLTVAFGGSFFQPLPAQAAVPPPSFTATPTFTITPTKTLTPTPFVTATPTLTPTLAGTPTCTPTGTLSPVLTPPVTHAQTATITPTNTKTMTRTPTVTPTVTSTPGVFQFSVSPQPDASNEVHFKWGTTAPAEHTYMRIFTSGLRPVLVYEFNKDQKPENLTKGTHEITWNCMDEEGRPMPPGTYICFISITVGKKTYDASGKTEIP